MGQCDYFRPHISAISVMEENIQENTTPSVSVKKHVIVYGKHDYIVKNVLDLLVKAEYSADGYVSLEETLDHIRMRSFDAVLIGGGVDPHDRIQVKNLVGSDFKHAKVIEHYGGPATILSEIRSAIG